MKSSTLDVHAKVKIPAETQTGAVFRLRGKSIKALTQQRIRRSSLPRRGGTPVKLTGRQKELLRELEEINQMDAGKHSPRAKLWMEKVKDFFI